MHVHSFLCIFIQVVGGALKFDVWATVIGGGMSSQAGAIRLGVARALQVSVECMCMRCESVVGVSK